MKTEVIHCQEIGHKENCMCQELGSRFKKKIIEEEINKGKIKSFILYFFKLHKR